MTEPKLLMRGYPINRDGSPVPVPQTTGEPSMAEMSAHTPGPWNTAGIFNPGTPDEYVSIWGPTPPGCQSGDQVAQKVRPEDARLICAAHEMLSALLLNREYHQLQAAAVEKAHADDMDGCAELEDQALVKYNAYLYARDVALAKAGRA